MTQQHPYRGLPSYQFWKSEPGIADPTLLDPVIASKFKISKSDRIVTAGSCFAQHVARFMGQSGYNHYIAEPAHPIINPEVARRHHYGLFSARYGNIYTTRQLKQLLQRAFGDFDPAARSWVTPQGDRWVDPFRPQIQPDGYSSEAELLVDQRHHLACVRQAIKEMDVFVFTLGLTECWVDSRDGAVFPLAPGVAGGKYDSAYVDFRNFEVDDTANDLVDALRFIRGINPNVRFLVTVSPVPLNATYVDRHVLTSTVWSKSVLRVAAERASQQVEECAYFPSYEIITSPHVLGRYFADDRREVTQDGVNHVMDLFIRHYGSGETRGVTPNPKMDGQSHAVKMEERMQVLCDEESISSE